MSKQHEKPGISPQELNVTLGRAPDEPVKVSGGQFVNFRKGWAKAIFSSGGTAHWFERDGFDQAVALCGAQSHVRWMYGPGNYPKCSNCVRIMSRRIKSGVAL